MSSTESTRLLKANAIRGLGSKIVFNYEDIYSRCDEHVEQARQEAARILEQARLDAETLRQQAAEEGAASGRAAGLQDAKQQIGSQAVQIAERLADEKLGTTLPALETAARMLAEERDRWMSAWESLAIRLGAGIAGKILGRELQIHPEQSRKLLANVLKLAAGLPRIRLRLNPDDLERLGDHAEQIVRSMASCGETELVADESISSAGCVIETGHGVIDATIETQLDRIASELLQRTV